MSFLNPINSYVASVQTELADMFDKFTKQQASMTVRRIILLSGSHIPDISIDLSVGSYKVAAESDPTLRFFEFKLYPRHLKIKDSLPIRVQVGTTQELRSLCREEKFAEDMRSVFEVAIDQLKKNKPDLHPYYSSVI
ncbi:MAG: hypothetical protein WCG42_07840 [Parachlamydiaceae bacterium]